MISVGENVFLYPMPVTLLGANVRGKANFMPLGWISRVNAEPPMVGIGVYKPHHTCEGILENRTFSINVPDAALMKKTDYCGLVSGKDTDKSGIFSVFYGQLGTAPMIHECPLRMECRTVDTLSLPTNYLFIGEIVASYTEERFLTGGKPDIRKINPLLLTMPDNTYWTVGACAGSAWDAGKELIGKE